MWRRDVRPPSDSKIRIKKPAADRVLGDADAQPDGGVTLVMLRVTNLAEAVRELEGRGVSVTTRAFTNEAGETFATVAYLDSVQQGAVPLALVEAPAGGGVGVQADAAQAAQRLGLKRFDHMAAFTPDLEATTAYWTDVLGIPKSGEVRSPMMIINQMRIGDGILELIGAASPDSPLASRPAGVGNNIAMEVADLDAAIAHARAAGFTPPDARPGVLPGMTFQAILLSPQLPSWGLKFLVPAVGALLALSAALAAACFVKAFGVTFLGRPRTPAAAAARETDSNSLAAMICLAVLCLVAGVLPGIFIDALAPVTNALVGMSMPHQTGLEWLTLVPIAESRSSYNGLLVFIFVTVSGSIAVVAIHRLASDKLRRGPAWDCGYPDRVR